MTKLQLKELIAKSYLQRPELLTSSSTVLDDALKLTHQDIQLKHNWRCMEVTNAALTVAAGSSTGVDLPAGYKKMREVWTVNSDGTLTGPMQPASEDEANLVKQVAYQTAGLKSTLTGDYEQRYFEKDRKLFLLRPPDEGLTLQLDYYAFLTYPSTDAATDYFLDTLFELLASGAAMRAAKMLGDTDRAALWAQDYGSALQTAIADDEDAKQGAAETVYRPPLPQRRTV
jgi:hypothetical protein